MSKPEFCVNAVVAKVIKDYITPENFDDLKATLRQHTYGRFKWKLVRDISRGQAVQKSYDPKFNDVKRILFINEASVILQDVELSFGKTRFDTYKVMLRDWDRVFIAWAEKRVADWDSCWEEGCRMYGADV